MEIAIRSIAEAERARRDFVFRTAFALQERFAAPAPGLPAVQSSDDPAQTLAAFADGELAACMITLPLVTWINGGPLPLGGVSAVASLPEYRRLGLTGAMLRRALADMRDRGEVLSGLFTPHLPLYTRYGWEPASQSRSHSFATRQVALRQAVPVQGRYLRVAADDWQRLDTIWRRFITDPALANCQIERDEQWWRNSVFNEHDGVAGRDLIAWADDHGEWQGWLCFREDDLRPAVYGTRLTVRELVACTPAAMQQLIAFLLRHDRAAEVLYEAGDDLFRSMLNDASTVRTVVRERLLLRVVDLPAAVALRRTTSPRQMHVRIEIEDRDAPWNAGTWLIESVRGRIQATRNDAAPQASMSINGFATLFNGYFSAADAARAGLLQTDDPAAVPLLGEIFALSALPHMNDGF